MAINVCKKTNMVAIHVLEMHRSRLAEMAAMKIYMFFCHMATRSRTKHIGISARMHMCMSQLQLNLRSDASGYDGARLPETSCCVSGHS